MKKLLSILLTLSFIICMPVAAFASETRGEDLCVSELTTYYNNLNEQFPDAKLDVDNQIRLALKFDKLDVKQKQTLLEMDMKFGPIARYTGTSEEGVKTELLIYASGNTVNCGATLGRATIVGNKTTYEGTDVWCSFMMGSKQLVAGFICNHTMGSGSATIERPVSGYAPTVWVSLIPYNYIVSAYDYGSSPYSYCKMTGNWAYWDAMAGMMIDITYIGVKFDANTLSTTLYT